MKEIGKKTHKGSLPVQGQTTTAYLYKGRQLQLTCTRADNYSLPVQGQTTIAYLYKGRQLQLICTRADNYSSPVQGPTTIAYLYKSRQLQLTCTRADNYSLLVQGQITTAYLYKGRRLQLDRVSICYGVPELILMTGSKQGETMRSIIGVILHTNIYWITATCNR